MVRQRRRLGRACSTNRCAHKGTPLVTEKSGNTGRFFRCPYHAWTYRLDGAAARGAAAPAATSGTARMRRARRRAACRRSAGVAVHREFVFVEDQRAAAPTSPSYFGEALALDRQPGRPLAGRRDCGSRAACLRTLIRCNWKIYLENINDTVHPLSTHESASGAAAQRCGRASRPTRPSRWRSSRSCRSARGHDFFDRMGGRVLPNGHSVLGTQLQHPLGLRPGARATRRRCARRTATSAPPRSCSARRRTRSAIRAWR